MKRKLIIAFNVVIVAALVIGNMMLLAPPAQAQEEVFLPMMSGNGAAPVVEIDIKGINDPVGQFR